MHAGERQAGGIMNGFSRALAAAAVLAVFVAGPASAPSAPAAATQTVRDRHTGFTGRGFTADYGQVSASDGWTVIGVPADGDYLLQVRYANGGSVTRTLSASVNDAAVGSVSFAPTGDWDTWGATTLAVHLNA